MISGRHIPATPSVTGKATLSYLRRSALKGSRDGDSILDRTGLILSDKAHATTRMRKTNDTMIEVQMTIEDPKALTKPWVVTKQFQKMKAGTRLYDYACAENNRNPVDEKTRPDADSGSGWEAAQLSVGKFCRRGLVMKLINRIADLLCWSSHHSRSLFPPQSRIIPGVEFDTTKVVELNGTIKEFQFKNPHTWIQVMVPNRKRRIRRMEPGMGQSECSRPRWLPAHNVSRRRQGDGSD